MTPIEARLARGEVTPATLTTATLRALDRLFGTALCAVPWPQHEPGVFFEAAGRRLAREAGPTAALVAALVPEPNRGTASLVEALAESLFVPRTERTEYVTHRLPSPPWDIRRLLLEYACWSVQVDAVLAELTKGFCADRCDRLPVGCCSVLGYDLGLVPEAMLERQELEARAQGWSPPAVEDKCKYHGPAGCCLRLFKSPACAGMLCDALVDDLRGRFPPGAVEAFLEALGRFRNSDLDRSEVFRAMGEVVRFGRELRAGTGTGTGTGTGEGAHPFT